MGKRSEGDWGETELDAAERANADLNLDDPSAGDDEPWSPPDRQPRGAEMAEVDEENFSIRMMQEDPDEVDSGEGDEDFDEVEEVDTLDLSGETGPEAGAMHLE